MELESLKQVAAAAMELERRKRDSKMLFYRPCCKAHSKWLDKDLIVSCPTFPCSESRHAKFHLSDKKIRVVFGGNRAGKTLLGLAEILMMSCFKTHPIRKTENPKGGRYRIYASDFGVIEKIHLPKIKEWIPKESLLAGKNKDEAWDNSYDPKYHILTLRNAVIDLMSYDQAVSKSASVELDGIWADEEMPEGVYAESMARIVSKDGKFWMTVTPLYDMSWAMRLLDEEGKNSQLEIFNFEIWDNPHLTDKVVREFEEAVPEHEKEARIHGKFLELQGLVYKELRRDVHMIKPSLIPANYPVIFCLDPHPRKPCMMGWAYVTPKDDVVFFDELEIGGTARDVAYAIREKERSHSGRTMLRLIDPAARKQGSNLSYETDTLKEFEREGIGFTLADNSEAGYNVVHEYLTYNTKLPVGPMNRPRCFFTSEVPKLWHSLSHLLFNEWTFNRDMRDKKETIRDYKKDGSDVVRYVLASRPTQRSFFNQEISLSGEPIHRNEVRDLIFGRT